MGWGLCRHPTCSNSQNHSRGETNEIHTTHGEKYLGEEEGPKGGEKILMHYLRWDGSRRRVGRSCSKRFAHFLINFAGAIASKRTKDKYGSSFMLGYASSLQFRLHEFGNDVN